MLQIIFTAFREEVVCNRLRIGVQELSSVFLTFQAINGFGSKSTASNCQKQAVGE